MIGISLVSLLCLANWKQKKVQIISDFFLNLIHCKVKPNLKLHYLKYVLIKLCNIFSMYRGVLRIFFKSYFFKRYIKDIIVSFSSNIQAKLNAETRVSLQPM